MKFEKEKKSKGKLYDLTVINITCAVALLLCIGFLIGFAHGRNLWHWENYVLDTEIVGHYGDFIGGVIGTFLSVILLYYTFYHQRKDSSRNSKVMGEYSYTSGLSTCSDSISYIYTMKKTGVQCILQVKK